MSIKAQHIEPGPAPGSRQSVRIGSLEGEWCRPAHASGIVLFAHGSGSSRHSSRNQAVAKVLQASQIATLLFDLLTPEEEVAEAETGELRFDISLLADRLVQATQWVGDETKGSGLGIGYFGASTGGAAALVAAAKMTSLVDAVVSRGGRPDLAMDFLPRVKAPTLLMVGARDEVVLQLNEEALEQLRCEKELAIIPRATHLFSEPGALEQVARFASTWFIRHFRTR
jgi:predicted alpha/beta-hydrolase family hydrolase